MNDPSSPQIAVINNPSETSMSERKKGVLNQNIFVDVNPADQMYNTEGPGRESTFEKRKNESIRGSKMKNMS